VKDYPQLYKKQVVQFSMSPVDPYIVKVTDAVGKDLVPASAPQSIGQAHLWFSIRLPPLLYSMCGWVYRATDK
jgi:hypothetical protein